MKKSLQQIIKNAIEKKRIEVAFDLVIGGEPVPVIMRGIDDFSFQRKRDLLEQNLRAEASQNGLAGVELPDAEWEEYLKSKAASAVAVSHKPKDRAEFFVRKNIGYGLLFQLVPGCLYTADGTRLLETNRDLQEFTELMKRDPAIVAELGTRYVELSGKIKEVNQTIKNSSTPESATSGLSGEDSPGSTQATEPPTLPS